METERNEIPAIVNDWLNIGGRSYTITAAQQKRRQRGKSIYERDRQVDEYKVNKGEWV